MPLGFFGHLMWLSGTLRDALVRAARFYSLLTHRATIALDEAPVSATATLTRRAPHGAPPSSSILTELGFASLVLRARAVAEGRFRVRAMRFSHDVRDRAPYEELFEGPVEFGAAVDQLVIDAAGLDLRLASAEPITAAALEARAVQMSATFEAESPLVDRVRRAVAAELSVSRPSLSAIARRVGLGPRSLRRHLDGEAVTLRAIVEAVRRERAHELLATGSSVKDVAFQLGFSEPSAFSRAYKRWTGGAPSTLRGTP